jgi:hypothetical protein
MMMPPSYSKAYADILYGIWSDVASQLLALLDALIRGSIVSVPSSHLAWPR